MDQCWVQPACRMACGWVRPASLVRAEDFVSFFVGLLELRWFLATATGISWLGRMKLISKVPPIVRECGGTCPVLRCASAMAGLSPRVRGEARVDQVFGGLARDTLLSCKDYQGGPPQVRVGWKLLLSRYIHAITHDGLFRIINSKSECTTPFLPPLHKAVLSAFPPVAENGRYPPVECSFSASISKTASCPVFPAHVEPISKLKFADSRP